MKLVFIGVLGLLLIGGSVMARKGRKLPANAYVKSAKIHILSGELDRYKEAEYMLDSLFLHYGPVAEGLFLMNQMMVDYIEKAPTLEAKDEYVTRMVAYEDSLVACCNNDDIDKKYRDDCDEFIEKADSTLVKYWREFYNAGVGQLEKLKTAVSDLRAAEDSSSIAFFEERRDALVDSTKASLQMAIKIDPTDFRSYAGISTVYEQSGQYDSANHWLDMGAEYAENPNNVKLQIAYNWINAGDYCAATTPLREYVDAVQTDTMNMVNLGVCYNACDQYDEAYQTYNRILDIAPNNFDALLAVGTYFNQQARYANDSATTYRDQEMNDKAEEWMGERSRILDSSLFYFGKAFEAHDTSLAAAEQYGMIAYVQGDFEKASTAYARAVEIDPSITDLWLSLGDAYIQLAQFDAAIQPYEKVIEQDPDNADILERLVDLYKEAGQADKAAATQAKLDKLQ